MEVLQAIPVLRIFDVPKARQFYLDYPGFRLDWEHRYEPQLPPYLQGIARRLQPAPDAHLPFSNRLRVSEDLA